jgi:membrane associated rhomboid family serine protease
MNEFRPSRFEVLPTIIKNLLIINVLVFIAQNTVGKQYGVSMDNLFALHTWKSPLFQPWQLITHMFMHNDIMHILGNMFGLWMFGAVLENLWGPKRFLTFYIICGLGAALLHLLFLNYEIGQLTSQYADLVIMQENGKVGAVDAMIDFVNKHNISLTNDSILAFLQEHPNDHIDAERLLDALSEYCKMKINTPTIGASGAIFGVLAAFVYLFPNTYLYLYFFFPIKAKWAGLAYFAYELFFAIKNSAGDNVARWAHVGGAIVGLLIVITWNKTNKKTFY